MNDKEQNDHGHEPQGPPIDPPGHEPHGPDNPPGPPDPKPGPHQPPDHGKPRRHG